MTPRNIIIRSLFICIAVYYLRNFYVALNIICASMRQHGDLFRNFDVYIIVHATERVLLSFLESKASSYRHGIS